MTAPTDYERIASTYDRYASFSDHEYRAGLARLERACEHAEADGRSLELVLDLRVYGTTGYTPR